MRRTVALLAIWISGCRETPPDRGEDRLLALETRLERLESQIQSLAKLFEPTEESLVVTGRVQGIEIGGSPILGPEDAPITIIEFADFECPYCAASMETLHRILAAYPRQVRLVFKHHPMPFHKQAVPAHRAAVAAAGEGKFWEMHRLIYSHQDTLDPQALREHARSLGLDLARFDARVASQESLDALQADREQAKRLGVLGVPAFFVNGRLIPGAQPFEVFSRVIEEELAGVPAGH